MSVIRLQEMTPQIYTEESRDFQLLSRLYDSVFNGLKFDTDSILDLIDTKECRTSVLQLLQTKLGFFTERKIDDEKLRSILECFPILVRNKGSLRAIKETLYLFLRMYSVSSNMEIYYLATPYSPPFSEEEPCVLASGKLPENNSLVIRIHSFETKPDTSVMEEIFRYILPAGINYYIEFDKGATLQDIVLKSEDSAELTFVSDNINSQLRSSDQTEPYNIGTVNTSSLISTDSYVSNRFIGYYGDEQSASDYLATLVDKIYSTAVINYSATGEVSGPIVSILDAEAGAPVEALSVAVQPAQDLHGYDNPWPSGGGKNKLNLSRTVGTPIPTDVLASPRALSVDKYYVGLRCDNYYYSGYISNYSVTDTVVKVTSVNNTRYGVAFPVSCSANTTYSVSATLTNAQISVGCYDSSWNFLGQIFGPQGPSDIPKTFTTPNDAAYLTIIVSSHVVGAEGTATNIQLELGSSASAWTPYANLCPISGWTEAKVTRTGKNMVNGADFTTFASWKSDLVSYGNVPTSLSNRGYLIPTFSGVTYTISLGMTSDNFAQYVYFCSADGTNSTRLKAFSTNTFAANTHTFTAESGKFYYIRSGSTANEANFNTQIALIGHCQLELGSTATAYEPYVGTTYPIPLGTTVYGGTLDVLTGVLTVDRAMVDGGDLTWTKISGNNYRNFYANLSAPLYIISRPTIISSQYRPECNDTAPATGDNYCWIRSDFTLSVKDTSKSALTKEEFKTAMTGVQFVYELATPIEISLTPEEITLYEGENNLWSDAGDISITYKRDSTYKAMICTTYSSNTPTWHRINFLGNLTTEEVSTQGGIVAALQAKGITVNNGDLIKYNNLYLLRVNNDWQECNYARYILNTYHLTE